MAAKTFNHFTVILPLDYFEIFHILRIVVFFFFFDTVETRIKEPRFFSGSLNRFLIKWLLF